METIYSWEMTALDLNCEYFGLSRIQLMENAGKSIADEIKKRFNKGKVTIFVGSGNNGGDGLVAARFLKGFDVKIVLAKEVKSDLALKNLKILEEAKFNILKWDEYSDKEDIIVDALLGTGFKGKLRRPYDEIVDYINDSDAFVVSVDVPSGLNADTGEFEKAVKADVTVTFHKVKPGLLISREIVGDIVVADIGIPEYFEKLSGPGDFKVVYKRKDRGHKGDHGKILVVGGSPYVGAPFLAAKAAYAAGADWVTLAVPEKIFDYVASFSPEVIPVKLKGDEISEDNIDEIIQLSKRHDVVVFGMGTVDKGDIAEELSKHVEKIVLDAGGITTKVHCKAILTPHGGEFRKHFGLEPTEENLINVAKEINATILLKGAEDLISDGRRLKVNKTGNAGMTVAGTGDVLAGVTAALFALNDDPFWVASAAAFINGYAGDMCLEEKGFNYTSTDLIEKIPYAVKKVMELK
uniref:Bifunctional NAD(P)H-hydrate repair enzyme n=1 Tax=Geoglobus ahangari TaxID=113653 RepID=A0A7C4WAX5_9EURY